MWTIYRTEQNQNDKKKINNNCVYKTNSIRKFCNVQHTEVHVMRCYNVIHSKKIQIQVIYMRVRYVLILSVLLVLFIHLFVRPFVRSFVHIFIDFSIISQAQRCAHLLVKYQSINKSQGRNEGKEKKYAKNRIKVVNLYHIPSAV